MIELFIVFTYIYPGFMPFQDLSFFKFIEVSGNEEVLVDLLKFFLPKFEIHRLENLTENLSEIEVLVYDKLTTPPQCVGPVNVMFLPAAADGELADNL